MFGFFLAALVSAPKPVPYTPMPLPKNTIVMDPTVTADGRRLFVVRVIGRSYTIDELRKSGATSWHDTGPASFSGKWRDLEEVLAENDSAMIFASNRPLPGTSKPLDGFYAGSKQPGSGGNLWIVHRSAGVWGTPEPFPAAVNANSSVFSPAVASDGTLYFMRASGPLGRFHLYVSRPPYSSARLAPFASATASEFDPTVSSDGSTVVFSSTRGLPKHTAHLFVSYKTASDWTTPRDLGPDINIGRGQFEARLLAGGGMCFQSNTTLYCTAAAPKPPGMQLHAMTGRYACDSGTGSVGKFISTNTMWGSWLRADVGSALVHVGFDTDSNRWTIAGVARSGSSWLRESNSPLLTGSQWHDVRPNDGGVATLTIVPQREYTFDFRTASSKRVTVRCSRVAAAIGEMKPLDRTA